MTANRSFRFLCATVALTSFVWLAGCNRLRPHPAVQYVYVVSKDTFLRDRVAAVSNKVAEVTNGERLEVVERGRRFLKVKTAKGAVGWLEQHAIIEQPVYEQFVQLQQQHAHDPVVATAVLRDDLYLHDKPGRHTERFYLLPEADKLQLLVRASVPKEIPPQALPLSRTKKLPSDHNVPAAPPPPVLEDWWLVRDSQGRVGWMLSRRMDVDVPDEIAGYAEGQRIVGAYVLARVYDPESSFPDKQAPEYVAVINPYKDGLPYDFDQVRVFTWNTKKHRYETAYRQRNLEGYLPVTVGTQTFDKLGSEPVFSFKVADGDSVALSPDGEEHPARTVTLTYRMEGGLIKKVLPPGTNPPPAVKSPAPSRVVHSRHHNRRHRSKK